MQCQSNLRWGFRKILCPSQNIWTLNSLIAISSWWCSRPDQLFSHAYGFKVNQNCMKKVEPNPTKWAFFCTIFNWNKKQMVLVQTQWDQRIPEGAFLFLWYFLLIFILLQYKFLLNKSSQHMCMKIYLTHCVQLRAKSKEVVDKVMQII